MLKRRVRSVDDTLRAIERRVVHDVWIGPVYRLTGLALATALCTAAVTGARTAFDAEYRVALIAHLIAIIAAVSSVGGLAFRRFAWVCVAAYASTLAAVATVGAFWWYRTGTTPVPWPTTVGCVVVTLLSVGWVVLLATPIERSQPDMRGYTYAER